MAGYISPLVRPQFPCTPAGTQAMSDWVDNLREVSVHRRWIVDDDRVIYQAVRAASRRRTYASVHKDDPVVRARHNATVKKSRPPLGTPAMAIVTARNTLCQRNRRAGMCLF